MREPYAMKVSRKVLGKGKVSNILSLFDSCRNEVPRNASRTSGKRFIPRVVTLYRYDPENIGMTHSP